MIGKVSTFLGPNGLFQGVSATPSLVLSLDSNNILSYPGTGVTWSDLSIRKNNGLLNNITSVTGSIPSTSLSFDGSTSYISFTQSDGIPLGTSSYTIEAWFNSNSYGPSEQGAIVGWGTTGVDNEANVLRLDGNGLTNYWWNNDYNIELNGTSSMIAGNWYYAVASFDGVIRKLYLNGELKGTNTPIAPHNVTDSSNLKIGNFYNGYFDGRISKVKISDKALSDSRILSNFNADKIQHGYVFGSMTFDETQSSYLISSSPDYAFGTNDFTVELFFKSTNEFKITSRVGIISSWINSYPKGTPFVYIDISSGISSTQPQLIYPDGSIQISHDVWYHVAISRTSGTSSLFLNGDLIDVFSDTSDYTWTDLVVGRRFTNLDSSYFNGIISNVRVINGTGLYTGTFSAPSAQLSATYSNTKFLINSQQTTPSADVSGLLHSVTASNIGWTSSLPSSYVTENLQFYVDAGLPSSYPGTGTTWYDISGNSRNLTMNSLSYSSNNGGYIIFDGSHTAYSVTTYDINFITGFTVETVAKFSGFGSEGLFAFNTPMNGDYINVQVGGTNIRWEVDAGSSFTTTGSLSSNTWYHVTCVYEGYSNKISATAGIYINGVKNNTMILSASRTGQSQTSNFVLGFHDNYLNGNIALSRMYNKVLSPSEVLNNFNYTKNRFGL